MVDVFGKVCFLAFLQISSTGWSAGASEINDSVNEYFRVEIIQKRNRRMAKRVIELLETYPKRKFFFAFGAGKQTDHYCSLQYVWWSTMAVCPLPFVVIQSIKSSRAPCTELTVLLCPSWGRLYLFTGHFLGNFSVIDYMGQMGYNITHLSSNHQIKRYFLF